MYNMYCTGGAAETAGVSVGDCVLEVNGEKCENCEPAKIVALKSMIQQTNVRELLLIRLLILL